MVGLFVRRVCMGSACICICLQVDACQMSRFLTTRTDRTSLPHPKGFSEQESTAVLPFHHNQRLNDAAGTSDNTVYAVSQNPTQLFTILPGGGSAGSSSAVFPTVAATDLLDFFPRYIFLD